MHHPGLRGHDVVTEVWVLPLSPITWHDDRVGVTLVSWDMTWWPGCYPASSDLARSQGEGVSPWSPGMWFLKLLPPFPTYSCRAPDVWMMHTQ